MSNVRSIVDHHANHAINALKLLLEATPEGVAVSLPQSRKELISTRERIDGIEHLNDSVDYIDFLLEQADLGRVVLAT